MRAAIVTDPIRKLHTTTAAFFGVSPEKLFELRFAEQNLHHFLTGQEKRQIQSQFCRKLAGWVKRLSVDKTACLNHPAGLLCL